MKTVRTHAFTGYNDWMMRGGHYSPDVLDTLMESMRADANDAKGNGTGRFRPSLIGDPCDRKQLLSHTGRAASTFKGNWYTWAGTFLHLAFQAYLLDRFAEHVTIEHDIAPAPGSLGVTGKADWRWWTRGELVDDESLHSVVGPHLGDYKTIWSVNAVTSAPKDEHVDQLRYEMVTAGVSTAYLVYQTRSTGDMVEWMLTLEPSDRELVETRLSDLDAHLRAGTLPQMLLACQTMDGPYKTCAWAGDCLSLALEGQ